MAMMTEIGNFTLTPSYAIHSNINPLNAFLAAYYSLAQSS